MPTPVPLSTLLDASTDTFDALIAYVPSILNMIVTQPVLAVSFGIFVTGAVIGLVTRLYRKA